MPETAEVIVNGAPSIPSSPDKNEGGLSGLWKRIFGRSNVAQDSPREPTTIEKSNLLPKEWLDNP